MATVLDPELKRRLVPADRRIFLSYARIDDEVPALDPQAKGWVRYLYDQLRVALRHRLGGDVDFWRDLKDIDDNRLFEPLIEEGLNGSALFLAIVSPSYLQSMWCQRERDGFVARHGGKARVTVERVIKVLKHRLDEQGLPDELRHRTGYRFFLVEPDTGREIPLYFNGKLRREAEYLDTVERLVDYIVGSLQSTHKTIAPVCTDVFVALSQGSDASKPTLRVRAEIEAAGLAIAQPSPVSVSEAEARARLENLLAPVRAAVHIVGRSAGATLRDGSVPAVHLQLDASGRRADRDPDFRRYILVLASHTQGSAEHRAYVAQLGVDLGEGGLFRATDTLVAEQPGGMSVQEFVQIVRSAVAG